MKRVIVHVPEYNYQAFTRFVDMAFSGARVEDADNCIVIREDHSAFLLFSEAGIFEELVADDEAAWG